MTSQKAILYLTCLFSGLFLFTISGGFARSWSLATPTALPTLTPSPLPTLTPTALPTLTPASTIPPHVEHTLEEASKSFPKESLLDTQVCKTLVTYNWPSVPAYHKNLLCKDNQIVGFVDLDPKTEEIHRFGNFATPLANYPDPPTAPEALKQAEHMLSGYGSDVTIHEPYLASYIESWEILVEQNDELIARVTVSGDQVSQKLAEQWAFLPPPPETASLPQASTVDCQSVNFIGLDSPEAEALSELILSWPVTPAVTSATRQAVAEVNPRWIAKMDDWVLLDVESVFGTSEPAILAIYQSWKKHPYLTSIPQVPHATEEKQIRDAIYLELPQLPPPLIQCVDLSNWLTE